MATKFDKMGKEKFVNLVESSNSIKNALEKVGYAISSSNYNTFHKAVKKYNVDISELRERTKKLQAKKAQNMTRIPLSEIMVRDSSYGTGNLKRRLIDNELLDYSCSLCGISRWRGAEISLHLDHINGNSRDHRLENLRLLRPNCHSQTDTYAGRNSRVTHNCPDCGIRISEKGRRCQSCANLNYYNTPWPDDPKVVLDQVRKDGYEATGKRYGVWGNTVKKYLKRNSLFKDLKLNG